MSLWADISHNQIFIKKGEEHEKTNAILGNYHDICDVTISGYPGEHRYYQYKMSDEITRCTTNKLYYDVIDTTGGQSGSPIYTSGNIVYGIHCYGYIDEPENSGTRITEWRYNYFCSFMD